MIGYNVQEHQHCPDTALKMFRSIVMFRTCYWCLLFIGILLIGIEHGNGFEMTDDKIQMGEFDVMPGGKTLTEKRDWEEMKYSCNFTYQCQGGTKESWLIGMSVNKDQTKFSCTVERSGSASYLFFQYFRMEVYGARLVEVEVDGPSQSPLKPEEYIMDENTNSVTNGPKFQSMLGKVVVYAAKFKEEL